MEFIEQRLQHGCEVAVVVNVEAVSERLVERDAGFVGCVGVELVGVIKQGERRAWGGRAVFVLDLDSDRVHRHAGTAA
ncbi:MAG: hypothetical protein ACJ716_06885 [Marmoricola sp.]